jgi:hypothetical protein
MINLPRAASWSHSPKDDRYTTFLILAENKQISWENMQASSVESIILKYSNQAISKLKKVQPTMHCKALDAYILFTYVISCAAGLP